MKLFVMRALVPATIVAIAACGGGGTSGSTSGTGGGSSTSSGTSTSSGGTGGAMTSSSTSSTSSSGSTTSSSTGSSGTGGAGGSTASSSSSSGGTGGSGGDPSLADQDGDGWRPIDGDCCDTPGGCANPELVNPGAFEYPGNGVDDDCDASTKDADPLPVCSTMSIFSGTTGLDLVRAMELCQTTTESPPLTDKKWGVISADLRLANGNPLSASNNVQVGVLTSYGPNVTPRKGATMAAISSGTARAPNDPGYVHPQNGALANQTGNYNASTQVNAPASFLAPHGGKFPSPASCPACMGQACSQAYDSVNLEVRMRVPTNAKSFSYNFKFYSAEFPEFLCQQYNDFFITLLQSTWVPDPNAMPPQTPLPADGNIAFDAFGNAVSVNNSFFQVCFPPPGQPASCPSGTLELAGTGMGGFNNNLTDGGGTEWLINDAPVVPGETITIRFMTWDAGDHNVDSLVLLDKFRWNITPSQVGVHK